MGAAWTLVRCSGSMECMDTAVIGMDNINDNNYLGRSWYGLLLRGCMYGLGTQYTVHR
jgi:hypothetical protein